MGINKKILTVNAGSSSIKLDVFELSADDFTRILHVAVTGIGQTDAKLEYKLLGGDDTSVVLQGSDFDTAMHALEIFLDQNVPKDSLYAIGHRVVHGGPHYTQPNLVTKQLLDDLESIAPFDPEHTPAAIELMKRFEGLYPNVEQVACFDTAFFHELPRVSQLLPIPRRYEAKGLRRYGFHGLSYQYVQSAFASEAGDKAMLGRVIFAHLGSGASLTATLNGQPIDTTMGFSPTSGIIMSSRTGDIDAGLVGYLLQVEGLPVTAFTHMINYESGLVGVSELSADMYTLLQNEETNPQAADAVALFIHDVQKAVGALATTIGGLDSLVFTGGIGEQSSILRKRICEPFGYLGLQIDDELNDQHALCISSNTSAVGVHVIATDEARVIAEAVIGTSSTNT